MFLSELSFNFYIRVQKHLIVIGGFSYYLADLCSILCSLLHLRFGETKRSHNLSIIIIVIVFIIISRRL
jgi:hypothetical protein